MLHRKSFISLLLSIVFLGVFLTGVASPEWGFFGHRRLNRLATFTLDADMMPFFRANIEYLTEHAVDPDKRRYASKFEAVRHYMDLDHWGDYSDGFDHVPRRWSDALIWQSEFELTSGVDTTVWSVDSVAFTDVDAPFARLDTVHLTSSRGDSWTTNLGAFRNFYFNNVLVDYYEETQTIHPDSLRLFGLPFVGSPSIRVREGFSEHGILPYHLERMHRRITQAFIDEDGDAILRLCAEMGHYVGDAHVPLHTTENYNGQLTGQTGIHAFWESRLPELFADERYDFFVGKARYIDDPRAYYWAIVLESHALVDSVLGSERRLREVFPADRQLVFDERLGRTVKTQSPEFAEAWSREMQGMVEERFRAAILSIGSVWYTCWVDAGQPDLDRLVPSPSLFTRAKTTERSVSKGRRHE